MTPGGASRRGSHRLSEATLCPRKWYFHNAMGLRPKTTPDYFIEGSLIHLALAYHFAGKMDPKPQWYLEKSLDAALEEEGEGYPAAIRLSKACAEEYARFYGFYDPWVPVAIEHEYVARVGDLRRMVDPLCADHPADDELVTSRIDLVVRIGGYLWHVDYKTTLKGSRGRLAQFNPDGEYALYWQFLVQTLILKKVLGDDYRGMLVERVYRKEPFDFDRSVVTIPRRAYLDAPNVIAEQCVVESRIAKDARTAAASGADMGVWMPHGHYWNCFSWGQPCEYRPLCTAEHDPMVREVMNRDFNVD